MIGSVQGVFQFRHGQNRRKKWQLTVSHHGRVPSPNCLIRNGRGEIDRQEHGVPLSAGGVEGGFEEHFWSSS
jgi:hypothetical protein